MGKKHPNVVNLEEVEPRIVTKGTKIGFVGKRLGGAAGAKQIGCSWYEIEPGRKPFPHHFHCANEEAIYVLEGSGELRIGKTTVPLEAGDYVALPAGPDHAHSVSNTGKMALRYLCMSTLHPTEVVAYPDSKKIAAVGCSDATKGLLAADTWIRQIFREQPSLDYYDGEDVG